MKTLRVCILASILALSFPSCIFRAKIDQQGAYVGFDWIDAKRAWDDYHNAADNEPALVVEEGEPPFSAKAVIDD